MQNNIWAQQNSTTVVTIPELFSSISNSTLYELSTPWKASLATKWINKLISMTQPESTSNMAIFALTELLNLKILLESNANALAKSLVRIIEKSIS
jgi:hypothetical protein